MKRPLMALIAVVATAVAWFALNPALHGSARRTNYTTAGSANSGAPSATPSGEIQITGPVVACTMLDGQVQVIFDGADEAACQSFAQELSSSSGQFWQIGAQLNSNGAPASACLMSSGPVKASVVFSGGSTTASDDAEGVCTGLEQEGWLQVVQ